MTFRFVRCDALPRLAWGATLRAGDSAVDVYHGSWVETGSGFFAEGCWDRPFGAPDLSLAAACMGSGGEVRDGRIVFASPSHTLERLHWMRCGDVLHVSNSLVFALTLAGDALDPAYAGYAADLTSFTRGTRDAVDRVPTRDGNVLRLAYCANLLVGNDLSVARRDKPATADFDDYASYVDVLQSTLRRLHDNATDPARAVRYAPLATVSSGYDSPACAVLAREIGCREAMTFRTAREKFADTDDSGREIGEMLGMHVHEFDRTDYLEIADCPEAEFLAAGTGGEEVVFAALQDLLPGRMLITGYIGDSAWNKTSHTANDEYWMRFPGGSSFGEFRLRVGFVHCPVPVICFRANRASVAVSNRAEMAPWSIAGDYDRPIPRRLVEERGVPRHLFGQDKKAVTQNLANPRQHATVMTPASAADFAAFARALPPRLSAAERLRYRLLGLAYAAETRLLWRREREAIRSRQFIVPRRRIAERYRRRPLKGDFTFHWAVGKLQPRYRDGLAARSATGSAGAAR